MSRFEVMLNGILLQILLDFCEKREWKAVFWLLINDWFSDLEELSRYVTDIIKLLPNQCWNVDWFFIVHLPINYEELSGGHIWWIESNRWLDFCRTSTTFRLKSKNLSRSRTSVITWNQWFGKRTKSFNCWNQAIATQNFCSYDYTVQLLFKSHWNHTTYHNEQGPRFDPLPFCYQINSCLRRLWNT